MDRREAIENDKELDELFNRLAALPPGTPSEAKLPTLTEGEQAKRRLMIETKPEATKQWRREGRLKEVAAFRKKVEKELKADGMSAGKARDEAFNKALAAFAPWLVFSVPLIEHAYPWRYVAAQAAVWLRKGDCTPEADAIEKKLKELPTGPVDADDPENMARQFDADRAAAEQVKRILAAVLKAGAACSAEIVEPHDYHVTLQQAAAFVSKSKRTLERWQHDDPDFPLPEVEGGGGNASLWKWSALRVYLK